MLDADDLARWVYYTDLVVFYSVFAAYCSAPMCLAYPKLSRKAGNRGGKWDNRFTKTNRDRYSGYFAELNGEFVGEVRFALTPAFCCRISTYCDQEMPECLLQFVAHTSAVKRVVKKWEQGDFSETTFLITFPAELNEHASRSYQELKAELLNLI